jgi:hypothetical protein
MTYDMGDFASYFFTGISAMIKSLSKSICDGDHEAYSATSTPRWCFACSISRCCQTSRSIWVARLL